MQGCSLPDSAHVHKHIWQHLCARSCGLSAHVHLHTPSRTGSFTAHSQANAVVRDCIATADNLPALYLMRLLLGNKSNILLMGPTGTHSTPAQVCVCAAGCACFCLCCACACACRCFVPPHKLFIHVPAPSAQFRQTGLRSVPLVQAEPLGGVCTDAQVAHNHRRAATGLLRGCVPQDACVVCRLQTRACRRTSGARTAASIGKALLVQMHVRASTLWSTV